MTIKGTLTYCNRCGFKIFREGDIKYGYTTVGIWVDKEPLPEGWMQFGDEHLCPECAKEWKKIIRPVRMEMENA